MLKIKIPITSAAAEPPEERGLSRDQTRLMVSFGAKNRITHAKFYEIVDYLLPGDLLVINSSATIPASLPVKNLAGQNFELMLSQKILFGLWIAEINKDGREAFPGFQSGESFALPGGASCVLHLPLNSDYSVNCQLWVVSLNTGQDEVLDYLAKFASPPHFSHHSQRWPLKYFQTVFADEPGSAEMPSAGRGFTPELVNKLLAKGIQIAPLVLHAGANCEGHIPPHEEYYRIPVDTAQAINRVHEGGGRVIAVGSTVVRALDTVTHIHGQVCPGEGWTKKEIKSGACVSSIDGLLTGLHEPETTHIDLLQSFISQEQLETAYTEALARGYLWHEFGDFHLILP